MEKRGAELTDTERRVMGHFWQQEPFRENTGEAPLAAKKRPTLLEIRGSSSAGHKRRGCSPSFFRPAAPRFCSLLHLAKAIWLHLQINRYEWTLQCSRNTPPA